MRKREITGMRVPRLVFLLFAVLITQPLPAAFDAVLPQCTFMLTSQSNFVACERDRKHRVDAWCSPRTICVVGGISGFGRLMDKRIVRLDFGRRMDGRTDGQSDYIDFYVGGSRLVRGGRTLRAL